MCEDYGSAADTTTQDAMIMLCYCYAFMLSSNPQDIVYGLQLIFDIMDNINYHENDDGDYHYETAAQEERNIIYQYISILNKTTQITPSTISQINALTHDKTFKNIFKT